MTAIYHCYMPVICPQYARNGFPKGPNYFGIGSGVTSSPQTSGPDPADLGKKFEWALQMGVCILRLIQDRSDLPPKVE